MQKKAEHSILMVWKTLPPAAQLDQLEHTYVRMEYARQVKRSSFTKDVFLTDLVNFMFYKLKIQAVSLSVEMYPSLLREHFILRVR
jgi:hypothetical protein